MKNCSLPTCFPGLSGLCFPSESRLELGIGIEQGLGGGEIRGRDLCGLLGLEAGGGGASAGGLLQS